MENTSVHYKMRSLIWIIAGDCLREVNVDEHTEL